MLQHNGMAPIKKSSKILLSDIWFISYFNNYLPLYTPRKWSGGNTDIFLFSKMPIPALGPTQPPFQWLLHLCLCRMDSKNISFTLKIRDWRLCTGFIWLSIGNRGGLPWTFDLHIICGIPSRTEQPTAVLSNDPCL